MSTFKPIFIFFGAVAVLSATIATPALAQAVISEPGYCAFFYPNANCQNKGPGNPYTDPNYQRNSAQGGAWSTQETVGVAGKRVRKPNSASTATRMQ